MTTEPPVEMRPSPPKFVISLLNAIISALLRSPLHGVLSASTLVLSFTGRKSGKTYTFPVGYYNLNGDTLTLIPLHRWWKNLHGSVPVTIWLKGKKYRATADAFQGDEATVKELADFVEGSSNFIRIFMIARDAQGRLDSEHVQRVARSLSLVRIRITPVGAPLEPKTNPRGR